MSLSATRTQQMTWPCTIEAKANPKSLRNQGPLISGWYDNPANAGNVHVRTDHCFLIDTGSRAFGIDESLANSLGLQLVRSKEVYGFGGRSSNNEYRAILHIPTIDALDRDLLFRVPAEVIGIKEMSKSYCQFQTREPDGQAARVVGIMGRIFLQFCEFVYNGRTGAIKLTIHKEAMGVS